MSTVYNFDGYSDFDDWCVSNGYDSDDQHDLTEEGHKGDTWQHFYVKHMQDDNLYAEVSVLVSYNHGWQEGEVLRAGLARKVTQVMTEKVEYV